MHLLRSWVVELFAFGIKQARAAIFAGSFFVLLFLSSNIPLYGIPRYDFLFVTAILLQIVLYFTKVETWDEVKTIFLFHIVGFCLELFKTHPSVGSWSYPEEALFKIATVPLFAGFMYAAVGSYIAQAWRIMDLQLTNVPSYTWSAVLGALIYLNFFTNHYVYDIRYILIIAIFALYWRTRVYFTSAPGVRRFMPLNVGFILVALFIWIAENISTYLGAWQYPDQVHVWTAVSTGKITSWFLMVIISFIIVAYLKHYKAAHTTAS